jgi:NAD-dependent SIR2 family protein deacetylase
MMRRREAIARSFPTLLVPRLRLGTQFTRLRLATAPRQMIQPKASQMFGSLVYCTPQHILRGRSFADVRSQAEPGNEETGKMPMTAETKLEQAALAIASADAIVIGAGAGMGVDSGLPDFRGAEGFWKAYPPYRKLGLEFMEVANPQWFRQGFAILHRWAGRMKHGAFVFTSNVDGQFQKAGFADDRISECHGSVHWMQCLHDCGAGIFSADGCQVTINEETMRAAEPLPMCLKCGKMARPNILMFGDWGWDDARTIAQQQRLRAWLESLEGKLAVIECGAGLAIPTVRLFCERLAHASHGRLIRINVREPEVPDGEIGLAMGALDALRAIAERLASDGLN